MQASAVEGEPSGGAVSSADDVQQMSRAQLQQQHILMHEQLDKLQPGTASLREAHSQEVKMLQMNFRRQLAASSTSLLELKWVSHILQWLLPGLP